MSEMKACRACGIEIPASAFVCHECSFYQDWRRHLNVGQLTLALLVALVSVFGAIMPPLFSMLKPQHSKFGAHLVSAFGEAPSFFVFNSGNAPGAVSTGFVSFKDSGGTTTLLNVPVVQPGVINSNSTAKVDFITTNDYPRSLIIDFIKSENCKAGLTFINFDGKIESIDRPYDCSTLLAATFRNGDAAISEMIKNKPESTR